MLKEQALEEIKKNAGTQFDPVVAQRFIDIMS
jgi:HD-GYP domain-containing protein (c-di-GMP phosphodiesterase class II)